jgi:hypothetical protein
LHDRIFGGFLMRRAFELAFSTAYSEYSLSLCDLLKTVLLLLMILRHIHI